jgi:hypothetical protein
VFPYYQLRPHSTCLEKANRETPAANFSSEIAFLGTLFNIMLAKSKSADFI